MEEVSKKRVNEGVDGEGPQQKKHKKNIIVWTDGRILRVL
jgi:hypothetical protein